MGQAQKKHTWRWRMAQFLEIRWWQTYLRKKERRQYLSDKQSFWKRVLQRLEVEVPKDVQVLDAGCGPAGIFTILSHTRVTAVDPLLEAYAQKLEHFSPEDYPWVSFEPLMLEDFESIVPFAYVFCMNAINHVANLKAGLEVLAEATQKEGTLVLSVDAHRWLGLKWLFRLIPGDALHPHQYDLEEYLQMIEDTGFRVQKKINWKHGGIFDYWMVVAKKL